jgi:L-alanine-DL-glutamate epimerase-like enolase superfamily enzyme
VKVKVGIGDDAGRIAAVRAAAGPEMAIRLDANGAWNVEEAVRAIEALAPAGLELVEEPVHGVAALREVRDRVAARIAIDESIGEDGALAGGAADAVCLKLGRAGGVSTLLSQATLVRTLGADVYVTSAYDGPLGVAAALHCAAALRVELPCGLATLRHFDLEDPLPPIDGEMIVPQGPGLGVAPYLG